MATTATNHWKLGLFVVTALGASIGSVFWLGARRFHRESFPAVTYFDESVQGLDVGSPVKFRGVTLGTVSDITIAPDHRHVQVTQDIYVDALRRLGLRTGAPKTGEQFIDPDLRVQLVSSGITGVRFLQTDFFDPVRFPPPQLPFDPPWNYVPSAPSTLKSVEDAAVELVNRLPELSDEAKLTMMELRRTLHSADELAVGLHAEDGSFNRALVRLGNASARVETALEEAKLGQTTASFRDTSASIHGTSTTVGEAAAGVRDSREDLHDSLVALREAVEAIRTLADSLERDPSALIRGSRSDRPVAPTSR
jgi:phospholipid/cholesterol/gamma-HCH transport system substrate-binding protein